MRDFYKPMFGNTTPSGKKFRMYVNSRPVEEREVYWNEVYRLCLEEWPDLGLVLQDLSVVLIHHNWQRFLNYLVDNTILGRLRYPLRHGDLVYRLVEGAEGNRQGRKSSVRHLSFSMLLCFEGDVNTKINTTRLMLAHKPLSAEEVWEWLGKLSIEDGDARYRKRE